MNKRGISAIVATILIVLLVVAGVAIIWTAIIPLISEESDFQEKVNLKIVTAGGYTFWDEEEKAACVQIERGQDNLKLSRVEVIFSVNGKSEKGSFQKSEVPGPNEQSTKCFPLDAKPNSIKIIPYKKVGNGEESLGVSSEISFDSDIPDGTIGDLPIGKLDDEPEFFPAFMDRRTDWKTGFNEAKLYLTSADYDVIVNTQKTTIHTEEQNPYIILPLEDQTKLTFNIEFVSRKNGTIINSETKSITYNELCNDFPAGKCPWEVKLATPTQLNTPGTTILFDEADLERIKLFKNSNELCEYKIYDAFWKGIHNRIGGIEASKPLKSLEEDYLVYGVVNAPYGDGISSSISIPLGDNAVMYDYLEILSGPHTGEFRIIHNSENQGGGLFKIAFYTNNKNFIFTPDTPTTLEEGTQFRLYKINTFKNPHYMFLSAMAYRLDIKGETTTPEDYYQFAKEMLIYDPVYGGGVHSLYTHFWGQHALSYDLIKERLIQDDLADGTNYNEQIRTKLARMMDYATVETKNINMWKVYMPISWTGYTFNSAATNAQVLADWTSPKGSKMTNPRDWMDNAMQELHRATYDDLYTKDGHLNTGAMYANAALQDISTFANIYHRLTGIQILAEPRFDEAMKTMIRTYFSDLIGPYGLAVNYLQRTPTTLYQNPNLVNSTTASLMQGIIEKEKALAARRGETSVRCLGVSYPPAVVPALFMYDKSTTPLFPEDLMGSDPKWRPTQFLPYANQVVFRDSWNYNSRELFVMGKAEGKGNYWVKNEDIGNMMYYEDDEHLFGPDTTYSYSKSNYQSFPMLADGYYAASRLQGGNGELNHYFSYSDESANLPFIQAAQIDSFFSAPKEIMDETEFPNYPSDVTTSRQILFLKDYILLIDEMMGTTTHDYEIAFTTPRLPSDIELDPTEQSASWSGVRVEYGGNVLNRDPTSGPYISSINAKRRVRIQQLNVLDNFFQGSYTPENPKFANQDLAYINQIQNNIQNAQFLTIISSDDNQQIGDELQIIKVPITGGLGAIITHPSDASYSDTIISKNPTTQITTTLVVNDIDFTGKLAIARLDNTNKLTDFYLREATALTHDNIDYFKQNSGDLYHLALSYESDKIQGSVEAITNTEIEIYSEFKPSSIELESHPENYPFEDATTPTISHTYSNNVITITIPAGSASLMIYR
jgi:hypothetical protein